MAKPATLAERLDRRLDKSGDCWEWTGCRSRHGYGWIRTPKAARHTHRVAWEVANGPIPEGKQINHRCNNPSCVKLDHLELGTHPESMAYRNQCQRQARGEKVVAHKLTEAEVLEIRASGANGVELAEQYESVWATAGFHPHEAKSFDINAERQLAKLLEHKRVLFLPL